MEQRVFSDLSYEKFLNEEKLMGSKCKNCGALYLPPRPICIKCYSTEMEWVEMEGKGKLAAYTYIYVGPPFMAGEGYDREHPYCVGVVKTTEGVRAIARIEGLDMAAPESTRIGMPLKVKYLHRGEEKTYLAFEPAR